MQRTMMKSKIHRATVTDANLEYEGSITIDRSLLEATDLRPYERVQVVDVNNGSRFDTYVIEGEADSGIMCVNGAAARLVAKGDKIIVISYGTFEESELTDFKPIVAHVDESNRSREAASLSAVGRG